MLKPRGTLFLSTPNKLTYSKGNKLGSPYHVKEYKIEELTTLLESYFKKVDIKSQTKNKRARKALKKFMISQKARERFVKSDVVGIRKMIPTTLKEWIWKYLGSLFGRQSQERLITRDFPIRSGNLSKAEYFIAVCKK